MGDSENCKVQKSSLKAVLKGKGVLWEITKMVKYRKIALNVLIKGNVPLGR